MKYFDIMDKEEKGIFISFTDKTEAENYLNREMESFPERCEKYGLHIVEKEKLTLSERLDKAFKVANNAIYFNDRSDYLSALYEICTILKPVTTYDDIGKKYLEE